MTGINELFDGIFVLGLLYLLWKALKPMLDDIRNIGAHKARYAQEKIKFRIAYLRKYAKEKGLDYQEIDIFDDDLIKTAIEDDLTRF